MPLRKPGSNGGGGGDPFYGITTAALADINSDAFKRLTWTGFSPTGPVNAITNGASATLQLDKGNYLITLFGVLTANQDRSQPLLRMTDDDSRVHYSTPQYIRASTGTAQMRLILPVRVFASDDVHRFDITSGGSSGSSQKGQFDLAASTLQFFKLG